ncbi:MAG: GxxExxY protein [Candidatus Latescibacteria bacterium]|nr:GxxExxY protein [Candidatus Latescibacterota bacterium]
MNTNIVYKKLAYEIMVAAFEVHNTLGAGFLEKVYENALMIALNKRGMKCQQQALIKVKYEGTVVGEYFADVLVNDSVVLELKTVETITDVHRAQAINYLKATGFRLAIIINFAKPKLEYKRIVV